MRVCSNNRCHFEDTSKACHIIKRILDTDIPITLLLAIFCTLKMAAKPFLLRELRENYLLSSRKAPYPHVIEYYFDVYLTHANTFKALEVKLSLKVVSCIGDRLSAVYNFKVSISPLISIRF